jgi:NAD-dependent dihydropyrimidine dehydrogenase PreA subunit
MPNAKITLVVSQGQSRNPVKRGLENELTEKAASVDGMSVIVVPNLYDLTPGGESYQRMAEIDGPIVFCSWLYGRAAFWVLDRNGVQGKFGEVELISEGEEPDDDEDDAASEPTESVLDGLTRPNRSIYCLDLRASENVADFLAEIERVYTIESEFISEASRARYAEPTNTTALSLDGSGKLEINALAAAQEMGSESMGLETIQRIDEHPGRRWYPVIDFSRCTNCMECIDFCLFGVYGVDGAETILVEQPDNCRKGCPACSRVCPHNAIIFPQHKTPAIAGAAVDAGGLKIDLSKLFGAPDREEDAAAAAARERDEQLILAGRSAIGDDESKPLAVAAKPKDDFDSLLDQLDDLDL